MTTKSSMIAAATRTAVAPASDGDPQMIAAIQLDSVCGGVFDYAPNNAANKDSKTEVGKGWIATSETKQRSDDAYRLDMIKQACDRKYTDGNGNVDQDKASNCFLDRTQ